MDGGAWWAAVHGVTKSQTRLSDFTLTFYFHALEKEVATHSSVLAWRIPGTGEPGGLPSMGSHRVGHNWTDLAAAAAAIQSGDFPLPEVTPPLTLTGWISHSQQVRCTHWNKSQVLQHGGVPTSVMWAITTLHQELRSHGYVVVTFVKWVAMAKWSCLFFIDTV